MLHERSKMKKRYTKKQIQESIRYWKNQLRKLNEKELRESIVKINPSDMSDDMHLEFMTPGGSCTIDVNGDYDAVERIVNILSDGIKSEFPGPDETVGLYAV